MTLKYENENTIQERLAQVDTSYPSPLYGDNFVPVPRRRAPQFEEGVDLTILRDQEVIKAMKYAEEVYGKEMARLGYSPLTIGAYSSSVGRFIQFLELGRVIPDREQ